MPEIKCDTCPNVTRLSREVAEFVLGWRIWVGATLGGQQHQVTLCPTCVGADPGPGLKIRGWGYRCHTCGDAFEPDLDHGGQPWDEQRARALSGEHQCSPEVEVYRVERPVVTLEPSAQVL